MMAGVRADSREDHFGGNFGLKFLATVKKLSGNSTPFFFKVANMASSTSIL